MNRSANLFLIGPSGVGKTTLGKLLAEHFGMRFMDLDELIETRTGVNIAHIFDLEGEAGFRLRERQALDEASRDEGIVMATGGGAVLDADNRRHLASRGFVVWLDAAVETLLERLVDDRQRPLLQGVDPAARLHEMARLRTPLYAACADLRHSIGNAPPAPTLHALIEKLDSVWQPSVRTAP